MRCMALALLLAAAVGAAARKPRPEPPTESIIVRIASDSFTVQSSGFSVQSAAAADAAGDLGQPVGKHLRRIRVQPGSDVEAELERLENIPGVEYAVRDLPIYSHAVNTGDVDLPVTPQALPSDLTGFAQQWGAQKVGAPEAWAITSGASSKERAITICVVDSGIDYRHKNLRGNLYPVGLGYNAVDGEDKTNPMDMVGHGTEVSGVIAAGGVDGGAIGMSWQNTNLLACRFIDARGWGQTSDAIQCLDFCINQKVDMIHASWSSGEWANKPLEEAVRRTQEAGILMVVSAGNQGANMDRFPYYPQAYSDRYDNLLVVGATDEFDDPLSWSNWDTRTVHLSAPGNFIYTTVIGGGHSFTAGTSIAAPFVTGAAALLQATARDRLNRTLTYLELKSMLMDSTEKVATLQGRVATGGRLRADWALQRLLGLPLSPASPCMERPGTHTGKCSVARRSMLMRMDGAVPVDATVDPKHAGAAAETMGAAAKTTLKMGPGRRLQSA